MYAVDNLSGAIDVTREFLTPVEARTWLKLAVVVFFVSGVGVGMPSVPTGDGVQLEEDAFGDEPIEAELPTEDLVELAIVLAIAGALLWLVFTFIRAMMEFVLVASLRSGQVNVRRTARRHLNQALSLFAFKLVFGLVASVPVAIAAYLTLSSIDSFEAISLSALAGLVLLSVAVGLVYVVGIRLTTEFVVPVMLLEGCGVRRGWGRFWRTLRSSPGEYAVYVILATIVGIVASIAVMLLTVLTMIVLAIPLGFLFVLALLLGPLAVPLIVLLALVAVVSFLLVMALYEMPVVVYVRYYALLLLGDTDETLDLIPERRVWVRSGDDWDARNEWAGPGERAGSGDGSTETGWSDDADQSSRDSTDDGSPSGWDPARDDTSDHGWAPETDDSTEEDDERNSDGWGYRDDER